MAYSEYFEKMHAEIMEKFGVDFKEELAQTGITLLDPDASIKGVKDRLEMLQSKGLGDLREETIEEFMERLKTMTF